MVYESLNANTIHPVPWALIAAGVVGGVVFAVVASVVVYKCYSHHSGSAGRTSRTTRQLSSAIRKGLRETTSLKKSPTHSSYSSRYGGNGCKRSSPGPITPTDDPDMTIPQKPLSRSPTSDRAIDANMIKTEVYVTNETRPICSPSEKDVSLRERGVDEKPQKLGNLFFNVSYDGPKSALMVSVIKMCDLPARDSNQESSDPYIKLQLLPEKRHKVKTRVLRKTLNPIYDETFTFYGVDYNQLGSITLHFVVLSFDRFSRDDVIGEVLYPLSSLDQIGFDGQEIALCREIAPRHIKMHCAGRGEMLVSLCYQPAANRLTVVILKARNLPKMDITGLSDPYAKIYLLYNGQRIAKKKTHVKKRTLNPVFNESFLFDVPGNEGLANISLELQMLDWDRMTKNEVIGRLELGAKMDGMEGQHWQEVINCPRKQIAEWHKLTE